VRGKDAGSVHIGLDMDATEDAASRLSAPARDMADGPESSSFLELVVNGEPRSLEVEGRTLLVHALRDGLGLTGAHIGCDTSQCGACTVLLDGRAVKSCTMLALQADGRELTTIEGFATDGELHPLQRAFVEHHGLQCGFCTPGVILTAADLLARNASPTDVEIRHALRGNLCRCTGYQGIVESIRAAGAAS